MMRAIVISCLVCIPGTWSLSSPSPASVTRRKAFTRAASITPALLTWQYGSLLTNPDASALDLSEYSDGPQGIKYLVTKEGNADKPKPQRAQKVKTSYTLTLNGFKEDGGKQIDSSKGIFGDKPFEFYVGTKQVIKGWDLSLLDMREGEARRLIIPSDLGYGSKGAGGSIPPDSTLYFEVELTEIGNMAKLNAQQEQWLADNPL
uniref:peptidylprolyl isomerase n=2 Tax=Ditylum brightwellii TaxID=49249 RepID=A0A6S8XYD4_9STRA